MSTYSNNNISASQSQFNLINSTSTVIPLKVTVLGDSQTGKSTFLKQLSNNKENESLPSFNQDLNTNQFYEVYVKDFKNNVQIVFQFTDDPSFLPQSVCCVLIYDISNYQSYDNMKSKYFELAQSQMLRDFSFPYIIGNKMDLDTTPSAFGEQSLREVEFEEAQEFAQSKGLLFNEVSSIKRKNIELVLKMLRTRAARMISENTQIHLILDNNKQAIPSSFNHISTKSLASQRSSERVMSNAQAVMNELDEDLEEFRMISQQDHMLRKASQQSSKMNTMQMTHKQLDTAHFGQERNNEEQEMQRRMLLNSILESKLYKSEVKEEESPEYKQENKNYQSISLNDINTQGFNQRMVLPQSAIMESAGLEYGQDGGNESDMVEDDRLLQSLEKRFQKMELDNQRVSEYDDQQFAIRTEQSPTLYKEESLVDGQTPQFQLMHQKKDQKPFLLEELSQAVKKYDIPRQPSNEIIVIEKSTSSKNIRESQEDRVRPYTQHNQEQIRKNSTISQDSDLRPLTTLGTNLAYESNNDFLRSLDNDIKRTEESLKEMNDRFTKLKQQQLIQQQSPIANKSKSKLNKNLNSISPIQKDISSSFITPQTSVPIFEASLFKSFEQKQQQKQQAQIQKSRNNIQNIGALTERQSVRTHSQIIDHKEKPLISLRIKLTPTLYVSANIYKDDTPQTVSDRVFRHANVRSNKDNKEMRRLLAQVIEHQVNQYILNLKDSIDKEVKEHKKLQKQLHQVERERRLNEASQISIEQMNTAKRLAEKEEKKTRVIGKLSIIVGANKKGDIVVREGDNILQLVKSFMAMYGLKRDLQPTIIAALEQLIKKTVMKKEGQGRSITPNSRAMTHSNMSMSMEEHELKLSAEALIDHSGDKSQGIQQLSQADSSFNGLQPFKGKGKLLFRLNFELGEGNSAKINVCEGDNFEQLAKQFAETHNLGQDAVHKVYFLIEETFKIHKQKENQV